MNLFGFSLLVFFSLSALLVSAQNDDKYEDVETVGKINKHVLLTIKSPDGDLIDKRNQPTFNHSDDTIQEAPTKMPTRNKYARKSRINRASHIWLRNTAIGTKDSIPIRRSTISDVMRINSTSEFKKKQKIFDQHQLTTETHEHASVVYDAVKKVYGATASIKKAKPLVHGENGFSQAHLQIKTGLQNFESITVGWHVFPELYGDEKARIFLLWTSDGYQTTKCYNYNCEGFKRLNDGDSDGDNDHAQVRLGGILDLSSSILDIDVNIWKDPIDKNWWLMIEGEMMGKWEKNIFPRLGGYFTTVEWGGEVSNNETQMGSGHFGREEGSKACYIRNLEIMTQPRPNDHIHVPFSELSTRETDPDSYNVSKNDNQHYIYFGGRGLATSNP